jgi:hypothetical protein
MCRKKKTASVVPEVQRERLARMCVYLPDVVAELSIQATDAASYDTRATQNIGIILQYIFSFL